MKVSGVFKNVDTIREMPVGSTIFEHGAPGTEMFGVIEGEVELHFPNGRISKVGTDETFGEMALIDSSVRTAKAIAATDVKLGVINQRTFLFLVHETPMFALQVMSSLADRLRSRD
jgi:CRP-like cAMP-binding protein